MEEGRLQQENPDTKYVREVEQCGEVTDKEANIWQTVMTVASQRNTVGTLWEECGHRALTRKPWPWLMSEKEVLNKASPEGRLVRAQAVLVTICCKSGWI